MLFRKSNIPSDLRGVDARLRRRPELDEDRLELIAARARSRARASALSDMSKEPSLRSRLAILLTLTLGFGLSGAGVGLAVTGVADDDTSAADAQYAPPANGGETLTPPVTQPDIDEEQPPVVRGETDEEEAPTLDEEAAPTQEARQLRAEAAAGQSLPFTGFAAIPVLLMGLALLATGFVMRRRGTDA